MAFKGAHAENVACIAIASVDPSVHDCFCAGAGTFIDLCRSSSVRRCPLLGFGGEACFDVGDLQIQLEEGSPACMLLTETLHAAATSFCVSSMVRKLRAPHHEQAEAIAAELFGHERLRRVFWLLEMKGPVCMTKF